MRISTIILLVAFVLSACGGGEQPSTGGSDGSPEGDWELVDGLGPVAGFPITLSIGGAEASGRAACNSYFGAVTVRGDQISFGGLGQTAMGCEPPAMAAESAFLQALGSVDSFTVVGSRLTLSAAGIELGFEPVAVVPTAALVDTEWVLETLIDGESASSVMGDAVTLLLSADGTLDATTGCRTLTGRWLENSGAIIVPDLSAAGECPVDLLKQDSLVITVIGDDFTAEIDGDRLTLSSMGGDGLSYRSRG